MNLFKWFKKKSKVEVPEMEIATFLSSPENWAREIEKASRQWEKEEENFDLE
jgi:uncharacterized membrane protein